ncbi:MAG: AI-2E family transporter [Sphingopyxis sp.]|uniref:AI-2E family transporter n=1 Tax=Sphingopyxis sp. TaxID=1908224 RepID=UPI002ABA4ABF|nr:AI-2E family transporter [Sphingopyxis sp.]MDZ3831497.1 AI-2E family transporter [Sphingopyxis sp.]
MTKSRKPPRTAPSPAPTGPARAASTRAAPARASSSARASTSAPTAAPDPAAGEVSPKGARAGTDAARATPGYGQARVAATTLTVLAIGAAAWMVVELTRFFMLVFAAVVLGAVFDAIASWLCRRTGIGRPLALALSVAGIIGLFVGVFALFGSQLANEFDTIRQTVPAAIQNVEAFLDRYGWGDRMRELTQIGGADVSRLLSQAGGYAIAAGSGIADFLLVLVGAIFLAGDPATYRRGLLLLLPRRAEDTAALAIDDAGRGLRGWMVGQAVSSLVVAALTWAGLALLGVPAAGGLGLIAGLLDVIPMVGPVIAGFPAVLLAFTVSPATALWTLILFLVIQQLQGNFLQPMIQRQAVDVPPAVLLFAVVAAGLLFGFLGVLLAAPLTVVVYVLVQRVYVKTLLGKDIKVAGRD